MERNEPSFIPFESNDNNCICNLWSYLKLHAFEIDVRFFFFFDALSFEFIIIFAFNFNLQNKIECPLETVLRDLSSHCPGKGKFHWFACRLLVSTFTMQRNAIHLTGKSNAEKCEKKNTDWLCCAVLFFILLMQKSNGSSSKLTLNDCLHLWSVCTWLWAKQRRIEYWIYTCIVAQFYHYLSRERSAENENQKKNKAFKNSFEPHYRNAI